MKRHLCALGASSTLCGASSAALAHVKWFAPFDAAEQPLAMAAMPLAAWLTMAFVGAVFWVACYAERTSAGPAFLKVCELATTGLQSRIEDLFRGAAAVFFAALAFHGDLILTPELKTSAGWVPLVQAAIAMGMFWRSTLPLSALGILSLFLHGIATYGSFHMMDYTVFLGIAAFFVLSASQDPKLLARRVDVARYGLAFSLMWAAVEKWAYPHWTGHILQAHPHLGMGIDQDAFIALAGAVEFGLAFGLLWTPAIRKAAAAVLAVMMTVAILEFGAVDAIGHLLIIVILIAIVAERDVGLACVQPAMRSPFVAPAAQVLTLVIVVSCYYGAHHLIYGVGSARPHGRVASAAASKVGTLPRLASNPPSVAAASSARK
jgi:hypothetical protein